MEKTIEYMRTAVLAECEAVCPQGARHDVVANDVTIGWMGHGDTMDGGLRMYFFADWMYIDADMDDRTALLAYRLLGLDKRDALEAERVFWTASTDSLTKSLEAEKVKNANLQQQLEEAQNVKFEGMASPAWAMLGELTKFMEEVMDSDTPRTTSWCVRLEDGEEVTLMNIWAATSHDNPITRATELRDMLQQVLNHSNRPEMDDAQFRMFAWENINHLLYGNKEGKKDE